MFIYEKSLAILFGLFMPTMIVGIVLTRLGFSPCFQDEHLINHFIRNNLLKPVISAFVANGNRYNLLNSAVLELFEYIRKVITFFSLS